MKLMTPPARMTGHLPSRAGEETRTCLLLPVLLGFAIIVRTFGKRTNLEETMLTAANNEVLTRVGPGPPLGYWVGKSGFPAFFSWERRAEGEPMRLLLLGEQLIAFRDTDG